MAIFGFELEEIARLVALVDEHGLEEFLYEEEGRFLRVRGPRAAKSPRVHFAAPLTSVAPDVATPSVTSAKRRAQSPAKKTETVPPPDQIILEAPRVGVFHRAAQPGDPPFVNVGDRVAVGQTIGIFETMKVFNELPADHAGIITSIPVKDGQEVKAGTPLLVLRRE